MRLGGLKNCIDCKDFCLSVCRSFSNRKPIFYYYLTSELDVPTFCWFPWADIPSATISFLYLRDPVLFSLRFRKTLPIILVFQKLLWKVFFLLSFFHPLAMLLLRWFSFVVLVLVINNYCSNIVIHVYRFTNKLLII